MSDATVAQLESLSNEVLLDIFEYLDAYILCAAFYGHNRRFNALLRSCHLHVLFNDMKSDAAVWNTLATFIDLSRIQSLSLHSPRTVIDERFLPSTSQTLRSLSLEGINKESVKLLLQRLPLNQIKRLNVFICRSNTPAIEDFILRDYGHRLVSLVDCSLRYDCHSIQFSNISTVFPHLRRLSLQSFTWSSDTNQFLFKNTPNLRSLQISPRLYSSKNPWTSNDILKHIRELDIVHRDNPSTLPTILALFPGIRRLHIQCHCHPRFSVLDGTKWQQIIEQHVPYLQQMTLDFENSNTDIPDEQIVRTFQRGEFWSKRRVVAHMKSKPESRYRQVKKIYFGRPWHF